MRQDMAFEERLISAVQEYSILYDCSHAYYYDSMRRENAWTEIGETLNESAEECKRRWKLLRDGYRRANLKKKTKSGQATIFVKPWKFEKQMAFLHPTFQDQPQVSNLGSSATQMVEDDDEEVDVEKVLDDNVREPSQFEQQTPHTAGGTPTDPSPISDTVVPSPSGSTSSLYKRKAVRHLSAGEVLQNYLATKREEKQKELRPTDQLSKFFSAVEETVRQLPVDLQLDAKSQIFSIVLEQEKKALERQQSHSYPTQFAHSILPFQQPSYSQSLHPPLPPMTHHSLHSMPGSRRPHPESPSHSQYAMFRRHHDLQDQNQPCGSTEHNSPSPAN
ncbi:transcription factor Adf-1-like [Cryptotermes secundus]|uniref:transcription factor Adf-1-like n=1 Tax=Cryptotermes secundus TaxID=105785 RepID=UPI001454DB41|nr:transcription factor Adf-1-like [Cryptotermes secundus]